MRGRVHGEEEVASGKWQVASGKQDEALHRRG